MFKSDIDRISRWSFDSKSRQDSVQPLKDRLVDLLMQPHDLKLGAQVHFIVQACSDPVLCRLPILAHHNDWGLDSRDRREQHTLTDTARIRLPAVGGAIRAAARLREDTRVASLNTSGDHEAGRARLPFESARFLLHAGEAWATVGDRDFARRRLLDAHAIAVRHRFFELQMKAEDAMEALDRNAAVVPATNLTASSVPVDSDGGPVVRAGIERLEALSV